MATALITGASGGIGMEMARILAKRRTNLVLVARRKEILHKLKEEIERPNGIEIRVLAEDLTDHAATDSIFTSLQAAGIAIDFLINNAGFGTYGLFWESDLPREQEMIDLNISALTRLTRHFLPGMIQRGEGRILNVASTAAFQPGPVMSVYYASKAYVLLFSEALATELEGTGVTVTTLCPGPTATGFIAAAGMEDAPLFKRFKPVSARGVAEYGLDAMMAGKRVAVHGIFNRIMAFSNRLAPRKFTAALAYKFMKG